MGQCQLENTFAIHANTTSKGWRRWGSCIFPPSVPTVTKRCEGYSLRPHQLNGKEVSQVDTNDKALSLLSLSLAIACDLLADSMVVDQHREDVENGTEKSDEEYEEARANYFLGIGSYITERAVELLGYSANEMSSLEEFFQLKVLDYNVGYGISGGKDDEPEVLKN